MKHAERYSKQLLIEKTKKGEFKKKEKEKEKRKDDKQRL